MELWAQSHYKQFLWGGLSFNDPYITCMDQCAETLTIDNASFPFCSANYQLESKYSCHSMCKDRKAKFWVVEIVLWWVWGGPFFIHLSAARQTNEKPWRLRWNPHMQTPLLWTRQRCFYFCCKFGASQTPSIVGSQFYIVICQHQYKVVSKNILPLKTFGR